MHHGEAQAGAFARAFGCKERLGCLGQRVRVHAHAGISDAESHVCTWIRVFGPSPSRRYRLGRQRERPAQRHRIAGIHHEVQQRQFQLIGVHADRRQIGRQEISTCGCPGRAPAPANPPCPSTSATKIDRFGLQILPARKSQQALRQRRAALRTLNRVFEAAVVARGSSGRRFAAAPDCPAPPSAGY